MASNIIAKKKEEEKEKNKRLEKREEVDLAYKDDESGENDESNKAGNPAFAKRGEPPPPDTKPGEEGESLVLKPKVKKEKSNEAGKGSIDESKKISDTINERDELLKTVNDKREDIQN